MSPTTRPAVTIRPGEPLQPRWMAGNPMPKRAEAAIRQDGPAAWTIRRAWAAALAQQEIRRRVLGAAQLEARELLLLAADHYSLPHRMPVSLGSTEICCGVACAAVKESGSRDIHARRPSCVPVATPLQSYAGRAHVRQTRFIRQVVFGSAAHTWCQTRWRSDRPKLRQQPAICDSVLALGSGR